LLVRTKGDCRTEQKSNSHVVPIQAVTLTSHAPGSPHTISLIGHGVGSGAITNTPTATNTPTRTPTPTATATPTATPIPSGMVFGPTTLDFGQVPIFPINVPIASAMLSNTGSSSVTISGISVSPPYDLAGSSTRALGTTLAAGSRCQFDLTFYPSGIRTFPGTLTVTTTASDSPHILALNGTGIANPGGLRAPTGPLALSGNRGDGKDSRQTGRSQHACSFGTPRTQH